VPEPTDLILLLSTDRRSNRRVRERNIVKTTSLVCKVWELTICLRYSLEAVVSKVKNGSCCDYLVYRMIQLEDIPN